jgi:hypothetical protein
VGRKGLFVRTPARRKTLRHQQHDAANLACPTTLRNSHLLPKKAKENGVVGFSRKMERYPPKAFRYEVCRQFLLQEI